MSRNFSAQTYALLLSTALALNASHALSRTQQQQPPQDDEVVRISSDLVQTDVMVFDKSGKFVEGLKPEQYYFVDQLMKEMNMSTSRPRGAGAVRGRANSGGGGQVA